MRRSGPQGPMMLAYLICKCYLEGCSQVLDHTAVGIVQTDVALPPYKMALLYSCHLSRAVITLAMFEPCQGISESVQTDTNQMLIKDVKNETICVATAQCLNRFTCYHRCTLTD